MIFFCRDWTTTDQQWAKQAAYLIVALFALIAVLFCAHIPRLFSGVSGGGAGGGVELLIGQRDAALSALALALLGMMWRLYAVMRQANSAEIKLMAIEKQAKSASDAAASYLKQNDELMKQNEELRRDSGVRRRIMTDDAPPSTTVSTSVAATAASAAASAELSPSASAAGSGDASVVAERDAWQAKAREQEKKAKDAERSLDALKKQAAAQSAEYVRLVGEKESLQRQLEDFNEVFGEARKKKM